VRIDGWYVDGFGVLHDLRQEGLGPGVTVLLGENEAGKSTLLAFVRAILFGFPRANARDERSYPPLRGGRHGGELFLRDEDDGLWVVSRYAEGRRAAGVVRPDGTPGSEADLSALLGHTGPQVFKSVFAFGLDELQRFETLTGEGVGSRIFDSTISGAGRSAREAMTALAKRQDGLLKQRGAAEINDKVRQIGDLDRELREARQLAGRYASLQATVDEMTARTRSLDDEVEGEQRRKTLLETFIELRPTWDELQERRRELAELPEVRDSTLPSEVAALAERVVRQGSREEGLDQLKASRAAEAAVVTQALARLGEGWTVERVRSFDASVAVQDQARSWRLKLDATQSDLRDATRRREEAEAAVAAGRVQLERIRAELPGAEPHGAEPPGPEPLTVAQIDAAETTLARLRDDVSRLDTLKLLDEQGRRTGAAGARLAFVSAAFAALAAVAAGLAGYAQLTIGLAVAAALVLVVGWAWRRAPRAARGGESSGPGTIPKLEAAIAEAARSIGLSGSPSPAELTALESRLKSERSRRASWDAVQGRLSDAQAQVDDAERQARVAQERETAARADHEDALAEWSSWLAARGLADLTPDGVVDLLAEVRAAREAGGRLEGAERDIAEIERAADVLDKDARSALERAGRPCAGLSREAVRQALVSLDDDLRRRESAQNEVGRLERAIAARLERCADPEAATDELAAGDPGVWGDEAATLGEEIERLRHERDDAVAAASEARVEIRQIEQSADIPRLEEQRAVLQAGLAELADEYRVVSTARLLISETLKDYVRDRQPAVLASASEAFAAVTGGRYASVIQDEEGELETVVVVGRDGARLTPDALSRGTQQQLYLCIRLALAEMFAQASAPLPLIMDDCLVNFDPKRAAALAALLAERAAARQALLFTCHPETAELMRRQTAGPVHVLDLPVL